MKLFSILHISDFHIGRTADVSNSLDLSGDGEFGGVADIKISQGQTDFKSSFVRFSSHSGSTMGYLAQFAYDHASRMDAMIVSGDLAKNGRPVNLNAAFEHVSAESSRFFFASGNSPTLNFDSTPVFVLPGNHDRYWSATAFPNSMEFDSIFSRLYPRGKRVYSKIGKKNGEYIAFVFSDFTFRNTSEPKNTSHMFGGGHVATDVLQETVKEIRKIRAENGKGIFVWVMHFWPEQCAAELELTGYQKIQETARQEGIAVILCGHTHRKSAYVEDEYLTLCAGSATCADDYENNYLHFVHLQPDESSIDIVRDNYISVKSDPFVFHSSEEYTVNTR